MGSTESSLKKCGKLAISINPIPPNNKMRPHLRLSNLKLVKFFEISERLSGSSCLLSIIFRFKKKFVIVMVNNNKLPKMDATTNTVVKSIILFSSLNVLGSRQTNFEKCCKAVGIIFIEQIEEVYFSKYYFSPCNILVEVIV
jgi:hypothetical protein